VYPSAIFKSGGRLVRRFSKRRIAELRNGKKTPKIFKSASAAAASFGNWGVVLDGFPKLLEDSKVICGTRLEITIQYKFTGMKKK
jgi:hypothetical protein